MWTAWMLTLLLLCAKAEDVSPFPPDENAPAANETTIEDQPVVLPWPTPPDKYYRNRAITYCICSPTDRGRPPANAPEMLEYVKSLRVVAETPFENLLRSSVERLARYAANELAKRYGVEGMVNADAHLRDKEKIVSCAWHAETGKNFGANVPFDPAAPMEIVTLKPCDQVEGAATDERIREEFIDASEQATAVPIPEGKSEL